MKAAYHTAILLTFTLILLGGSASASAHEATEAVYPDVIPTMQGTPTGNQWRVAGPQREHYNLHITSSVRNGDFAIDDRLVIRNRKGAVVLDVKNVDPAFFAQLPPGHYVITAMSGNATKVKRVILSSHRALDVNFVW